MDEATRTAITKVVDYLLDDERKDFEANPQPGHIFEHLKLVRAWLDQTGD